VQLISKTGTKQYHGTAFNFVRNDAFDARPFGTVGEMPPFTLNQFGANAGGPLFSGRTFFFANYEGLRQRQVQSATRFVPSEAFRAAAPASLATLARQWPAGTGSTSDPNIDEWQVNEDVTADENAGLLRVDLLRRALEPLRLNNSVRVPSRRRRDRRLVRSGPVCPRARTIAPKPPLSGLSGRLRHHLLSRDPC
jgi:hypothetical protein